MGSFAGLGGEDSISERITLTSRTCSPSCRKGQKRSEEEKGSGSELRIIRAQDNRLVDEAFNEADPEEDSRRI